MREITAYAAPFQRGHYFAFENMTVFPSGRNAHVYNTWHSVHLPRTYRYANIDIVAGGLFNVRGLNATAVFVYIIDPDGYDIVDENYGRVWRFDAEEGVNAEEAEDFAIEAFNDIVESIACGNCNRIAQLDELLSKYDFARIRN